MTWLMIGKVALLVFLVLGCSVLVIGYVRRRRAGIRPMRDPNAAGYLDLFRGTAPPTPLPEWAEATIPGPTAMAAPSHAVS